MGEITYAYAADIFKTEKSPDGHLYVFGKAAGPELDLDGQICDPAWLEKEMPDWMEWGNVRAQHGPVAAGIGKVLDGVGGGQFNLKAKVVDSDSKTKVEEGVYKGYSIGIKHARVVRDAKAPKGRIVGGKIVEVSLVDRPANPTARLSICKAAGGSMTAVDMAGDVLWAEELDLVEKVLSGDLHKSLATMSYDDAAEATADAITELCELIEEQTAIIKAAVADGEAAGVEELNKAVKALGEFVDDTPTESAAELIQKALSGDSNSAIGTLFRAEITKAVAEAKAPLEEQLKTVQADLAKALAASRPGGPMLLTQPTPAPLNKSAEADRLSAIAASHPEPEMRLAYQAAAAKAKEVAA